LGQRRNEVRFLRATDPNREDDSQYIVHLVGQVVRVSVETVKSVKALPAAFAPDEAAAAARR
jgi:hypothetical protein